MSITINIPDFRVLYPQFADVTAFPDLRIQAAFDMSTAYVSDNPQGCMSIAARTQALYLMTAHLLALQVIIASNNYTGQVGIVNSAGVDKVQVTLSPPPFGTSQWRWWLNTSPYGAQLVALLDAQAVGGFYIGGLPERAAFRKVGGVFWS